ncbi:hypothetical protein CI105_00760 [Candidatus Izimaplasma bacterium ZiA1]|uniref:alanine/ornithine racemase family PLP-dependent enzyme n=1 Tax=Candidatus Izimoplasma sp. ZiA1 TaxID=2024899 RepID=UPI000BAA73F8|nr:hypothetical protein CI105_00760 [Candidatus Izimaplasma bacterium ZiA1]
MYPLLKIDTNKFKHNLNSILSLMGKFNLSTMAVSKVFCAEQNLIDIINCSDVEFIADSRLENLKKMVTTKKKVLLRLPSISDVLDTVHYSDISLNSEILTIRKLNEAGFALGKTHEIILMIDLGDLREGIFDYKELRDNIEEIKKLKFIKLIGLGTNLTCYGGVIPTTKTYEKFRVIINKIKEDTGFYPSLITGGNSSSIDLLINSKLPDFINNLRIGEALVLGRETAYGDYIDDMYNDVFTLEAELIEVKNKPSLPIGEIGMNAFGEKPSFIDIGNHKRGIISIGRQDVDYNDLIPLDVIDILGSSSDHIILDLSKAEKDYQVGDIIKFNLTYGSVLSLFTSKYVEKKYE